MPLPSGLPPGPDGDPQRPVVRAVYPSPWTSQYRDRVDPPPSNLELEPQSFSTQGYVRTSLLNTADFQSQNFAEKYLLGRAERPYFARTSGWELQFWDPSTDNIKALKGIVHPVGSLDLRTVIHVEAFKDNGGSYQVRFGMSRFSMSPGFFFFHVDTSEEADMWASCAAQALAEHSHLGRMHRQEGLDRAALQASHVVRAEQRTELGDAAEVQQLRFDVSPGRHASLRRVWDQCLRAVGNDGAPPPEAFAELFQVYDADRDGNLNLDELETMLCELVAVRRKELERALATQRQTVVTPERIMLNPDALAHWRKTVGDAGNKILSHYNNLLQPQGFESRAVMLRSHLDTSHDGQVSMAEFVRSAPQFLLPLRELYKEVHFFKGCAKAKGEFAHDDEKEEPGCVQQ